MTSSGGYLERPAPSGLADVVETILDKGLVLDAYARVSLVGIEILTVDARIVVASVDTYLRFAEATNRLELETKQGRGLPDLVSDVAGPAVEKVASKVVEKKLEPVAKPVRKTVKKARAGVEKVKDVAEEMLDTGDDEASEGR
jgi:hypothetical protein